LGQRQVPFEQTCPVSQFLPHAPQFAGSFEVVTQVEVDAHHVLPVPQVHVPFEQVCAAGQTLPHVPQFWVSVFVSVQPAAHIVWPDT
jgi:hypothetical protein